QGIPASHHENLLRASWLSTSSDRLRAGRSSQPLQRDERGGREAGEQKVETPRPAARIFGALFAGDGRANDSAADVADRLGRKAAGPPDECGGSPLVLDPERERCEDSPPEEAGADAVARVAGPDNDGVASAERGRQGDP